MPSTTAPTTHRSGINEKQSAVDAAQAALTEKQTQLSDAQSSSQAAKNAYAADMANMKTQIEAGASYTDLAALADQLAADYTAVQEAADACRRARQRRRAQTVHCSLLIRHSRRRSRNITRR